MTEKNQNPTPIQRGAVDIDPQELTASYEARIAELEQYLREQELRFQHTLQNTQNIIYRLKRRDDNQIIITLAEGKIAQKYNITTEFVYGKTIVEVFTADAAQYLGRFEEAFAGEVVWFDCDLGGRIFHTQLSPVFDAGVVAEVIASAIDITEARQAETERWQMAERFKRTLALLPSFIFSCTRDEHGRIRFNFKEGALVEDFAHLTDKVEGATVEELYSSPFLEQLITSFNHAFTGEKVEFQSEYAGRLYSVFAKAVQGKSSDDPVSEIVGVVSDISDRKRTEEVLHVITQGITAKTGVEFFRYLVQHLTQTLGVQYAFVGKIQKGREDRVQTLAVARDGEILENVEYNIAGTSSEYTMQNKLCSVASHVQERFPQDKWLHAQNLQSHIGIALHDSNGHPTGIITVMDSKPIPNVELIETMLTIFAVRAAAELERQLGEEELRRSNAILMATQEAALDGILIIDHNLRVIEYNSRLKELWGASDDVFANRDASELIQFCLPLLTEPSIFFDQMKYLSEHPTEFTQMEVQLKDGRIFDSYSGPVMDGDQNSYGRIWYFRDVTDRKRFEEQMRHQVYFDSLTGLPNRILFEDRLTLAISQAKRTDTMLAVMFLDLDRFKVINDTLGHSTGDMLLQQVATRLERSVQEGNTICRLVGDEFQIILQDITSVQDAVKAAQHVLDHLGSPFIIDGNELFVATSIGISLFPSDGKDSRDITKHAKAAMYRAKESGGNKYQLYTSSMNETAFEKMALEKDLRKAIERNELVIYYQPRVDLVSGRLIGMEALVRWDHPHLGRISPAEFIPLAEESGLIIPLDEYVLKRACAQNKSWQDQGYPPLRVAVNLSAIQFQQRNLAVMIQNALKESQLEPQWLEIEITEGVTMHKADMAVATLHELKELGIHIAIDDFGTGYSSLSYLKKFPIDTLKIDRSFVRDITLDPDDAEIVSYIIALAHSLKLNVIAEGVETEGQRAFLCERSCDEMQGFLYSPPLSVSDFEDLLRRNAG
ncbi:sensor domain-containing protein [Brevibacillus dissolubilis]|uniref:sensor domain-containing protein n=1 Tax=Brevibacillus dissolubilis TaxID=1844116 RepID=UPI001115D7FE|nr:bifunctional diguanylate cyclase/phosphodiesterase [Brevibacillus dissolubilis]